MPKVVKRKPDLRRVRLSKVYTMPEIAGALDRSIETVRRWVKEGLPVLDDRRPVLIDGRQLKKWLKDRWLSKKKPCTPGEFFCFRCRAPKLPVPGSVITRRRNKTTVMLQAVCSECDGLINKAGSASVCAAERDHPATLTTGNMHLYSSDNPSDEASKQTLSNGGDDKLGFPAQLNLDFTRSDDQRN